MTNNRDRRINEIAETTIRVQCENGHWTAARTRLVNLDRRVIVEGQTCRCGESIS